MEHSNELLYENILLRPLMKKDIETLRCWRNNPDNAKYLRKIPYITPKMQGKWFSTYTNNNDEMCFAIVEIKELKRLVGSLSLYQFNPDSCFFGKLLVGDKEAHGRNVGLNATIAAVKIAFDQLKLKRVDLYVFRENIAAYKVYAKAGFEIIDEHTDDSGRCELTMRKENDGGKKNGRNKQSANS